MFLHCNFSFRFIIRCIMFHAFSHFAYITPNSDCCLCAKWRANMYFHSDSFQFINLSGKILHFLFALYDKSSASCWSSFCTKSIHTRRLKSELLLTLYTCFSTLWMSKGIKTMRVYVHEICEAQKALSLLHSWATQHMHLNLALTLDDLTTDSWDFQKHFPSFSSSSSSFEEEHLSLSLLGSLSLCLNQLWTVWNMIFFSSFSMDTIFIFAHRFIICTLTCSYVLTFFHMWTSTSECCGNVLHLAVIPKCNQMFWITIFHFISFFVSRSQKQRKFYYHHKRLECFIRIECIRHLKLHSII